MTSVNMSQVNNSVPFVDTKNEIIKSIDEYDKKFLSYVARLYESINGEKMNFENLKSAVDALAQFNKRQEYNYLTNLLYPEKCKGVKIPSPIPIPSCSFQLHNCVTLRTNSLGNLGIVFNPFFLSMPMSGPTFTDEQGNYQFIGTEGHSYRTTFVPNYTSSFYVNNADDLTGYATNYNWYPVNIGQQIPNVYNQYRLVSASLVVKYIGRLDIASGVIGGAIVFDESNEIGMNGKATVYDSTTQTIIHDNVEYSTRPTNLDKYGNFDLAMDSFYHQENLCIEGIRELYFPIDNSYEEYVKMLGPNNILCKQSPIYNNGIPIFTTDESYLKNGFRAMVYVLGAPANSACFKCDIYCNFECLPNAEFMNYLPLTLSSSSISPEAKKQSSLIVQQKPVMKLSDKPANIENTNPDIWGVMKEKFKGALPGIGKLIANGIVSAIPVLKPGLALANTLIDAVSQKSMIEEVD